MTILRPVALFVLACTPPAFADPIVLGSSDITATVDSTRGQLTRVENPAAGETYTVESDTCRIETSKGTIDLAEVDMEEVSRTPSSCEFVGRAMGVEITRAYSVPEGRAYFDRALRIRNVSDEPIVVRNVTDGALVFDEPFQSAAYHDDNMDRNDGSPELTETEERVIYQTAVNVFMRSGAGGLYAGVKYPYFKPELANDRMKLTYETNYRLEPGEVLELPTLFVGVYKYLGYIVRKDLDWEPYELNGERILVRVLSTRQEIMDLAEVRGMQQVMADYLPMEPCPAPGYMIWLNSWWANPELRTRWDEAKADAFCRLADQVKMSKCIDMISTAPVWCGWVGFIEPCPEIDAIGEDAVFPMNPAIDRAMKYVHSLHLPVTGFCEPNSVTGRRYREDRPDWKVQPTPDASKTLTQNCHANPAYEDWFYRLECSAIDQCGLSAWAWDHSWVRRPMVCYGKTHGHEPGNCEFEQYRNVTNHIARLRERYPNLFLEIYWGLKEAGPWSLRGLNSQENAYENGSPPPPDRTVADDLRFQHWFNHNYRFIPTYMNMAQFNFRKEGNGHLYSLLSSLSASTHAALCDWIPFETQEEADEIFALMRKWKTWATDHMQFLEHRVDLFGMPCRRGGIDGTAHILGDRGYVFVFNPTEEVCYGSVPLTELMGLTEGRRYALTEISTDTRKAAGIYDKGDEFLFEIPPKTALLFELTPTTLERSPATVPEGARIQPAFIAGTPADLS